MILDNNIGFMQGRLLPKKSSEYQFHPLNWEEEFKIANLHNIKIIEWIVDKRSFEKNSLMSENGRKKIISASEKYNIKIDSICADILLENSTDKTKDYCLWESYFLRILDAASKIQAKIIVIPLIENMSLKDKTVFDNIIHLINNNLTILKKLNIKLAFELDLPPIKVSKLLEILNDESIGINYDIGNSASLNFNIKDEFDCYSSKIIDIHVKDRLKNGGPCLLGTGNANLKIAALEIQKLNFSNPIIFQAYRDNEGLELALLQKNWFLFLLKNNFQV